MFQVLIWFRFSENLIETKQIGIKKGLYMGICQGVAQVTIYLSFAVTFWCRYLDHWISSSGYFDLDGPYLARTECQNYNAGTVVVVCKTIETKSRRFIESFLGFYVMFNIHI